MKLRVGTRGSALAMVQARALRRTLEERGHDTTIEIIKTSGDADQTRPFAEVGEPGLFVREIERALLGEKIDVAVHCYKDLPSVSPEGLVIAAVPEREDPRDVLVTLDKAHDEAAAALPLVSNARIGTASARRTALLRSLRPDLQPELLRGNVPTRLAKLRAGEWDAILLAAAGLRRLAEAAERGEVEALQLEGLHVTELHPLTFVPAPSQGALALQVRRADSATRAVIAEFDHEADHRAVLAERELLRLVEAGCQAPFGAWCDTPDGGALELVAILETAGELRRARGRGEDPLELARAVYTELLPEGVRQP